MAVIQIIEDELVLARNLARALETEGHSVHVSTTGAEGLERARLEPPDLVLLDLRLPDRSGLEVLRELRRDAQTPVLLMTAYASVRDAVEGMRSGAADYLQKPLDLDEVRLLAKRTLASEKRRLELDYLRAREKQAEFIGQDPRLLAIFERIARLRDADLSPGRRPPILLTGETGTGKGLMARTLHSMLGGHPFVELNCTALPESLVEAELFGHERGAFTDAKTARVGLLATAEGGTLFLDEIGHLDVSVQAKFLNVIEEKRVRRLGSSSNREVDVHIIAATNRDLDEAVRQGAFRSDLLHRLRVLAFEIPPLRERPEDILVLARDFCGRFAREYGGGERELSPEVERALLAYPWPGNVRELRNVLERAVLLSPPGPLDSELLAEIRRPGNAAPSAKRLTLPADGLSLEEIERDLLAQALSRAGGSRTRAAELLGLTTETFRYRLKKFGIVAAD